MSGEAMSEAVERIKAQVDQVYATPGLSDALEAPAVFEDRDQQATPDLLGEWASFVASRREFVGAILGAARNVLVLTKAMLAAMEDEHDDVMQSKLAEDAGALINRGFAAQERMAHAKVSQVEATVHVRAARLQVERLRALVDQLDHVHREWRADEFTIDRMIRVTQLRLQLGDV